MEEVGNSLPLAVGEDVIIQTVAGFAWRVLLALLHASHIHKRKGKKGIQGVTYLRSTRNRKRPWLLRDAKRSAVNRDVQQRGRALLDDAAKWWWR